MPLRFGGEGGVIIACFEQEVVICGHPSVEISEIKVKHIPCRDCAVRRHLRDVDIWLEVVREGGDRCVICFGVVGVLVEVGGVVGGHRSGCCGGCGGAAIVSHCALQMAVGEDGVELIIKENVIIEHREASCWCSDCCGGGCGWHCCGGGGCV